MPRIRKKTSKRTNLHQRARIKHKAVETRKKRGKEAKKNIQWKAKHPKDPGIPANFPYKDQILAEIVEERRQAAEEKEKRKEERKAGKAKAKDSVESPVNDPGIELGASAKGKAADVTDDIDDDEVPTLINPDYPNLQAILDKSDVVIHVLDARDPLAFRSSHLEELVGTFSRKLVLVLNKIDTCPREAVIAWAKHLRTQYPTFIFRSASYFLPSDLQPRSKGKEKERTDDALGVSSILGHFGQLAENKSTGRPLVVAVTGATNVGKSSFINSVLRKAVCPIYKLSPSSSQTPTTTTVPQEIDLEFSGTSIHLIDTPGISWQSLALGNAEENNAEATRAKDILLRSRGHVDRLKDPIPALNHIVSRASKQDLMLFYNLPAFADNDPTAFLSGVARANSLIKKGGDPDLNGAARIVLRDWSTGKFPRYTMPLSMNSTSATAFMDDTFTQLYAKDEGVLSWLKSRKDMRKSDGIIKLVPGAVETRKIVLNAEWIGIAAPDVEEEEDVDEGASIQDTDVADEDQMGEEVDDDADDDQYKEDESPQAPIGKRKRPSQTDGSSIRSSSPTKKVVFSSQPRSATRPLAILPLKSALKNKTATSAPKKGKAEGGPKVVKTGVHQAKDGEQAYDFGKFF